MKPKTTRKFYVERGFGTPWYALTDSLPTMAAAQRMFKALKYKSGYIVEVTHSVKRHKV